MTVESRSDPLLPRVRVLIVENESESLEVYRRLLLVWGYEPIVAVGRGVELLHDARSKAVAYGCQAALVDMRLFDNRDKGDTSGLDLIAELRPAVSVMVSAFGNERTTRDALKLKGAFDFFNKGDDPAKLAGLVQAAAQSACVCRHSGRLHWHPVSVGDLDGVVLSGLLATAQPFAQFYQGAAAPQVLGVLESLSRFCFGWQHGQAPIHGMLYDLYLGATQETLVQRATHTEAGVASSWAAAWPEPLTWIAGHAAQTVLPELSQAQCHRALNAERIFVDGRGEALLGNIDHAGLHHRLYDLVTLEIEVVTTLLDLPAESHDLLFELAIALAAPTTPGQALQPTRGVLASPAAAKAFVVASGIRALAYTLSGYTDQREYAWALLLELARRIMLSAVERAAHQRAQIFAAVLCRRLAAWGAPDWLPASWPPVTWADPPSHRREVVEQLFRSIAVAESCSFVGLPSMGKTHLLQHFVTRADVQQQYLGEQAERLALIFVDFDRLHELSTFSLYELLLAATAESCHANPSARRHSEELAALHRDVMLNGHALLAQRHLERAVALLCTQGLTVCFILDNFDKAFQSLPTQALDNLRALQARHWNQLCYVAGLSQAAERVRPDSAGEAFTGLIAPVALWLSQYRAGDAERVLEILAAQYRAVLSPVAHDRILWLSGRHPGLIEALCKALWRQGASRSPQDDSTESWLRWGWLQPLAQSECWKIWRVLGEEEQRAMLALARGHQGDEATRAALELKGLLRDADADAAMFSPLFDHFVRTQDVPDLLRVDRKASKVWRGETTVGLTTRPFEVLAWLYEHSGLVCTRDEILNHLYGDEGLKRAPNTVDTQIDRIRDAIEPASKEPRYLLTVPGRGYRLVGTDLYPAFE